ncbi:MAG: hypothetical protein ABIQ18_49625 [Umezawaea sp.]
MGLIAFAMVDVLSRSRGLFRGNAARRALRPIVRRLAPTNPKRLARNGDSGRGIGNTTPWYHLYLTVDLTPDLEEIVTSAARNAGYELRAHQELINDMANPHGPSGHNRTLHGQFDSTSSYLIDNRHDRTLSARIIRDGETMLFGYGQNVTLGQQRRPPTGKAIVSLNLSLPNTR